MFDSSNFTAPLHFDLETLKFKVKVTKIAKMPISF